MIGKPCAESAGWRPCFYLCPHCACPDNDGPEWHISRHEQHERQEDPTKWAHGTLYLTIHEAEHLPGDPTLVSVRRRCMSCMQAAHSLDWH